MMMNMKKILSFAVMITIVFLSGCAKFTDITPKGQNLLNRASDLDLLLNVNYSGQAYDYIRQTMLINDNYLLAENVPNAISGVQSMKKILLTYDETGDRAGLVATDPIYEGLYATISKVANIVITMGDQASGDAQLIKQLKAEAYIIRAFLHYRLVNIYAKAYDPATATSDGGIPYVTDLAFTKLNDKKTVKEVYDNLLSDLDAGISSGALPNQPKNSMRIGKGFAYGVKAQVLLSMRNYSAALDAVNEALKYNSTLEDHRPLMNITPQSARALTRVGISAPDNVFYAFNYNFDPSLLTASPEVLTNYETGNIVKDRTNTYNYMYGSIYVGLPDSPVWLATNYQGNSAGMTTSDLVLMKAECLIRTGKINEGMDEVNRIRIRRIDPANYVALSATTEAQAMGYLQKTSRIEFIFTIRNFINIKRWNREGKYRQTITRTVGGKTYSLTPDSKLYIFPFSQSATQFNETLTQNY
jgi:tetratricopeptide (TPR) repeat protein